eukprot:7582272-Alexandrium_andersonii.AAC.1
MGADRPRARGPGQPGSAGFLRAAGCRGYGVSCCCLARAIPAGYGSWWPTPLNGRVRGGARKPAR